MFLAICTSPQFSKPTKSECTTNSLAMGTSTTISSSNSSAAYQCIERILHSVVQKASGSAMSFLSFTMMPTMSEMPKRRKRTENPYSPHDKTAYKQEVKEAVIPQTHAIAHPRTVMVELHDAATFDPCQ